MHTLHVRIPDVPQHIVKIDEEARRLDGRYIENFKYLVLWLILFLTEQKLLPPSYPPTNVFADYPSSMLTAVTLLERPKRFLQTMYYAPFKVILTAIKSVQLEVEALNQERVASNNVRYDTVRSISSIPSQGSLTISYPPKTLPRTNTKLSSAGVRLQFSVASELFAIRSDRKTYNYQIKEASSQLEKKYLNREYKPCVVQRIFYCDIPLKLASIAEDSVGLCAVFVCGSYDNTTGFL
ncbi:hypothetical protein CBL_04070 [Carabus blaptoides fortunei]